MNKAKVIEKALTENKDTLFLDSDIIIIDKICDIDGSKDLGVSPQFIREHYVNETGYYNGGMLWVNSKDIPHKILETVARKYCIENNCKQIYVDMYKEMYKLRKKLPYGNISISISLASGSTATVAADVCIRPLLSVVGTL